MKTTASTKIIEADVFAADERLFEITEMLTRLFPHSNDFIRIDFMSEIGNRKRLMSSKKIIPQKGETAALAELLCNFNAEAGRVLISLHPYTVKENPKMRKAMSVEIYNLDSANEYFKYIPPTYILFTAGGAYQCIWIFNDNDALYSETGQSRLKEMRSDLCKALGANEAEYENTEWFQIPKTFFHKNEQNYSFENFCELFDVVMWGVASDCNSNPLFASAILDLQNIRFKELKEKPPKITEKKEEGGTKKKQAKKYSFFAKRKFDLLRLMFSNVAEVGKNANEFLYRLGCNECFMTEGKATDKAFKLIEEANDFLNKYNCYGVCDEELEEIKKSIAKQPLNCSNQKLSYKLPMHLLKNPYAAYTPKDRKKEEEKKRKEKYKSIRITRRRRITLAKKIALLYAEGHSVTYIAKKCKKCRQTIYNYLHKYSNIINVLLHPAEQIIAPNYYQEINPFGGYGTESVYSTG